MQLPLEYDEGHETNNDEDRAEAQVGKEVAREITWGGEGGYRENRMRTEHSKQKRGQHPTGHVGPEPKRRPQEGPKGRTRQLWKPQSTG